MSCALHEGILAVPSSSQRLRESTVIAAPSMLCNSLAGHLVCTTVTILSEDIFNCVISPGASQTFRPQHRVHYTIFCSPRMPGMHLFLVSFSPDLHILSSSRAQVGFFSLLFLSNSIWQWEEIWMPFCITNRMVAIATHHIIFANPIVFETLPFQSIILTWILFYIFLSCCFASNFLGISICRKFLN